MTRYEVVADSLSAEARKALLGTDPLVPAGTTVEVIRELYRPELILLGHITAFGSIVRELLLRRQLDALTPAEARTGISDRCAAALADVAELRRTVRGEQWKREALDRIEAALRERER